MGLALSLSQAHKHHMSVKCHLIYRLDIYSIWTYNLPVWLLKRVIYHMRVISKRMLREFWAEHARSMVPLTEWYFKMKCSHVSSMSDLRHIFNTVDVFGQYHVFNIGGNHFRLIAVIHYNTQCCYVRAIWTHAKYSKAANQLRLKRGDL